MALWVNVHSVPSARQFYIRFHIYVFGQSFGCSERKPLTFVHTYYKISLKNLIHNNAACAAAAVLSLSVCARLLFCCCSFLCFSFSSCTHAKCKASLKVRKFNKVIDPNALYKCIFIIWKSKATTERSSNPRFHFKFVICNVYTEF